MYDKFVNWFCLKLCKLFPNRHRTIYRADDPSLPLLTQFMVIPDYLYLQHFHNGESKEWFHHHRWGYMRSLVLSGSYVEERWKNGFLTRKRFRTHKMSYYTIHRVESWDKNCWTLFLMLDNKKDWGYYNRITEQYVPWEEFVTKHIPNLETGKFTKDL